MPRRVSLKPKETKLAKWPWLVNLPETVTDTGKRERYFFETKDKAETFCKQQRIRLKKYGSNSTTLSPGRAEEAAMAFERLDPYGVSLNTVVTEYISRHNAREKSVTFKELFQKFTGAKKNRSVAYLKGLEYTLPRFPALHELKVCDIEPGHVEADMGAMTPHVRNAFMRNLRAVFNFGIKRGYLENNPVAKMDFEDIKKGEVVTLTPKEAKALMIAAEGENDLLPYHALGLFAGIRPMELERLDWRHVDLVERHVEVTAEVSKTGRRRIIDIEPNLHRWLTHYVTAGGTTTGKVTPSVNLRTKLRDIRTTAKLADWTQDVMRHSYASYWLAHHADINRLTLQMGHESADMLWKHYNRAAKRKDAKAFWKIAPPKKEPVPKGKIVPFKGRRAA